jgi:hypothetical protein
MVRRPVAGMDATPEGLAASGTGALAIDVLL